MLGYRVDLRFTSLKLRSLIYVNLVALGIVWTVLLCAYVFVKQGFRSSIESAATTILLSSQVATSIGIPITALLGAAESLKDSRWFNHIWFELVSLNLLLSYQFGALIFSLLSPKFICHGDADEQGVCQLVNAYISICSWVTPIILFGYSAYTVIRCFKLSARYPNVWQTPFTLMPWNPNLLELDLEPNRSSSTLNKPRPGSLDEIKAPMSTGFSTRTSTQCQSSPNLPKFSKPSFSARVSIQSTSTEVPKSSRLSEGLLLAKSKIELQHKHQSRVQSTYAQSRLSSNTQSLSNFTSLHGSVPLGWCSSQDKDIDRHSRHYHKASNPLSKHDSRLAFQYQTIVPPNPPLLAHATLGPPIPLTLPSLRNKRIAPYLPNYYYYPPSPSTRRPAQLATSTSIPTSRVSLHPPSLYPCQSTLGTRRKTLDVS